MEINKTTLSVYYTARLFGFAPYSIAIDKQNKLNHIQVKYSRFLSIYSVTLLIVLAALTNFGLYIDATSPIPIRLKTATARVVTGFDVNILVSSCLISMFTGVFGLHNTQQMNVSLNKADEKLMGLCASISMHTNGARRLLTTFVSIVYVYICTMLAIDVWGYLRLAAIVWARDAVAIDQNVICFVPFYIMYIFFLTIHIKFAYSTYRIALRYLALNNCLQNSKAYQRALWRSNEPVNRPSIGLYLKRYKFVASVNHAKPNYNAFNIRSADDVINIFADVHELLGKAMVNVSSEFGVTILVLLISCLLHLVVTAYFFFLEVFGDRKDTFYTTVQILWLIFHSLRLLLIIEPCHRIGAEAGRTVEIVCDLLRKKGEHYALKNFWQQLIADNTFFSACGICRIDRPLLTTLGGAIATYLVILLQFNKSAEQQQQQNNRTTTS
ncbi:gustatory receptor for sugar taste 43a-like isoform X2 [Sitodiplosis mosellana]|uniref:gustatory receptor for sugar taste 43a-like isoform X2 n=1 Tax=Sitodiplosis mosellana TaxID=263140 RepID=UPI0024440E09|nr:gustatory receptor for sugar taste 43a-like isoform X2 [Sitodiplosis mosellana]